MPTEMLGVAERDFKVGEAGLLAPADRASISVPDSSAPPKDYELRPERIAVPKDVVKVPEGAGKVSIPKSAESKDRLRRPEMEQVKELSKKEVAEPKIRPVSEIALALDNPVLFFSKEISKIAPGDPQIERVSTLIRSRAGYVEPGTDVTLLVSRGRTTSTYFDREALSTKELIRTSAGPLERVGITLVNILGEAEFKGTSVPAESAQTIRDVVRDYRLASKEPVQLPEMPDLVKEIITVLPSIARDALARSLVYDTLEQIKVPISLKGEVLELMDKSGDLGHPLAYQQTLELAQDIPNHPWLERQEVRRQELLNKMEGSAQELFDSFDRLYFEASRELVFSGNLTQPEAGKVGLEIEFGKVEVSTGNIPTGFLADQSGTQLSGDWEMRREDASLTYDSFYQLSLSRLSDWFRDNATHLSSLHLHLDRETHPQKPLFGELLGNMTDSIVELGRGDKDTWEVRGVMVPAKGGNKLNPAVMADLIGLYARGSKLKEEINQPVLELKEKEDISLKAFIFGHICRYISDPEFRLSALMALRDDLALRAVNPNQLLLDFSGNDIKEAAKMLEPQMYGQYQRSRILPVLYLNEYSEEAFRTTSDLFFSDDREVRQQALEFFIKEPQTFREVLEFVLRDPDSSIRLRAAVALGKNPRHYATVNDEEASYEDLDLADVYYYSTDLLNPDNIQKLQDLFERNKDEDDGWRVLKAIVTEAASKSPRDFFDILTTEAHSEGGSISKLSSAVLLEFVQNNRDEVLSYLNQSRSPAERLRAVKMLGLRPEENGEVLAGALSDSDLYVRREAVKIFELSSRSADSEPWNYSEHLDNNIGRAVKRATSDRDRLVRHYANAIIYGYDPYGSYNPYRGDED